MSLLASVVAHFGRRRLAPVQRRGYRPRPAVEELEPRVVPATRLLAIPGLHGPAVVRLHGPADLVRGPALRVPGLPGQVVPARFTWLATAAAFRNELGLFFVDDAAGHIGRLRPGDPGYAAAALSPARSRVLFRSGRTVGAVRTLDLPAGHFFGLYLVQNATTGAFRAHNPSDLPGGGPLAFFSFAQANPDHLGHARFLGAGRFAWEDLLGGGSGNFDALTARVRFGRPRGGGPAVTLSLPASPAPRRSPAAEAPPDLAALLLPAVTVSLGSRASLPKALQSLSWQIGDITGKDLLIRARAPGNVYAPDGSLKLTPGTLPATGKLFYLRPDNSWTDQETAYAAAQASGSVSVPLPNSTEGEWQLEVVVRDRSSGQVTSLNTQTVLVSSKPAIDLQLNRTLANSDDSIRAELLTSAGAASPNVRLLATLTLPDGSERTLPALGTDLAYLSEGPAQDGDYVLLDQPLGAIAGPGAYHLRVRLLTTDVVHVLAMADAYITVDDTPGTVSGVVRNGAGQPLDGSRSSLSRVQAFDVDDGAVTAHAAIAADGSYQLRLEPGRYLISAQIVDGQGRLSVAQAATLTVIGPIVSQPRLDLSTGTSSPSVSANEAVGTPLAALAGAAAIEPRQPKLVRQLLQPNARPGLQATAEASDDLPKPKFFTTIGKTANPTAQQLAVVREANAALQEANPGGDFTSTADIRDALDSLAELQDKHTDTPDRADPLIDRVYAAGAPFEVLVTYQELPPDGQKQVGLAFVSFTTGRLQVIRTESVLGSSSTDVRTLLRKVVMQLGDVARDARARQDLPVLPILHLSLDKDRLQQNQFVHATVRLEDANHHLITSGRTITITHTPPAVAGAPPAGPEVVQVVTGPDGTATVSLAVGSGLGDGKVQAVFERRQQRFQAVEGEQSYTVENESRLKLVAVPLVVRAGQRVPMTALLFDSRNVGSVVGATISLTATGGTLSTDHVVTATSGNQDQVFYFTAGNANGIAHVTGTYRQPSPSGGPPRVIQNVKEFIVSGEVTLDVNVQAAAAGVSSQTNVGAASRPVLALGASRAQTVPTVVDGATAGLFADLAVGGDRSPSQPIQFSLAGAGDLVSADAQTNAFGEADVFYVAPPNGSGTATVTATATVDGQNVTRTLNIAYAPAPPQQVSISIFSPQFLALSPGTTEQFTALVGGSTNRRVTWSTTGGTITPDGMFTAGAVLGTFQVTATSVADPHQSASLKVTVANHFVLTGTAQQVFALPNSPRLFSDGPVTIDINLVSQDSGDAYHIRIWPVDFIVPDPKAFNGIRHLSFELGYKDIFNGFYCRNPPIRFGTALDYSELLSDTRDAAGNWTATFRHFISLNGTSSQEEERYKLTLRG